MPRIQSPRPLDSFLASRAVCVPVCSLQALVPRVRLERPCLEQLLSVHHPATHVVAVEMPLIECHSPSGLVVSRDPSPLPNSQVLPHTPALLSYATQVCEWSPHGAP